MPAPKELRKSASNPSAWARNFCFIEKACCLRSLISLAVGGCDFLAPPKTKKADVMEHPQVFDHVGLLVNEPPRHSRVALRLVFRLSSQRRGRADWKNAPRQ